MFKVMNNESVNRVFYDLDNDGVSEFMRFRSSVLTGNGTHMYVSKSDGTLISEYRFEERYGDVLFLNEFYFGDLFDTGLASSAFFTHSSDSVYLFIFSMDDKHNLIRGIPILSTTTVDNKKSRIRWLGHHKNENDEVLLYFWFDDSKRPGISQIVSYNISSKKINTFRFFAIDPQIVLVNDSGKFSIVVNTISNMLINEVRNRNNGETKCRYFVLNENLNFRFDPVVLADRNGFADLVVSFNKGDRNHEVFILLWDFSLAGNIQKLYKMNLKGEPIFEKKILKNDVLTNLFLMEDTKNRLLLKTLTRAYYEVNKRSGEISTTPLIEKNLDGLDYIASVQLDNKPGKEHVLFNRTENLLTVFRQHFEKPASVEITDDVFYFDQLSVRTGDTYSIILPGEKYINRLSYGPTVWVWLKYLFWIGVLATVNILIFLNKLYLTKKKEHLKAIESKIVALQLKNFRNQLDPHFMFNALNVIGSVIYREDRDVAYDYFTRFSRLMRLSMADSTQITRELETELQFTTDYLVFQEFRFKNKFEFSVMVEPDVDKKMQVPKMLIQGYAENSVRHGFYQINYKGKIDIGVRKISGGTVISIQDNGIGRKRSTELHTAKEGGIGLQVMNQQIELFNRYNVFQIKLTVSDITTKGTIRGTRVEVFIPQHFNFTISKTDK